VSDPIYDQGCQISLGAIYQITAKYNKGPSNTLKGHQIYKMAAR
jgi:hypothetical protein